MDLTGHTILVTGGTAGIGLAFAKKLLELGNDVIVTGRQQSKLDEVKAANPKLHCIQSDVAKSADVLALAERLKREFPKLDVLINNAGVMVWRNTKVPSADLESYVSKMNINFNGTVWMVSALIETLIANKGTIINVSSGLALVPLPAAPIYCASKAAVHSYTMSLRFQLEDSGVHVVELMPPAVATELAPVPDASYEVITTDALLDATIKALKAGSTEIRVGQSNQLHWMSRIAPGFINGQLWKGSKKIVPVGEK